MKLIKCRACQVQISAEAHTCPNCGQPDPGPRRNSIMVPGIIIGFIVIVGGASVLAERKGSPFESASEARKRLGIAEPVMEYRATPAPITTPAPLAADDPRWKVAWQRGFEKGETLASESKASGKVMGPMKHQYRRQIAKNHTEQEPALTRSAMIQGFLKGYESGWR